MAPGSSQPSPIEAVRQFNRFYTRKIGVLQEGLLDSSLSLTQVRVLYELAHRKGVTAGEVGGALGIDPGYLSRILHDFRRRGWMRRTAAKEDARRQLISLTRSGRAAFRPLEARSNADVRRLLDALSPDDQDALLRSMRAIEGLLGPTAAPKAP